MSTTDVFLWPRLPAAFRRVVDEVAAEYVRAKAKHGEMTLDGSGATDLLRLAALGEEYGEVAELLTYDSPTSKGSPERDGLWDSELVRQVALRDELIQVANVALTWASILPGEAPR